ncbi:MAG: KH domain-containing protein [Anaerolineae bacterium]|nr:KH domain-containing protein [Anaerolineae bacterium]MDQ7036549.1 KH domain-containing protein [Anaerolineae bacterium]
MEEELIRYIAENLVNDAEQVSLNTKDKGRTLIVELNVAPDDMGRVIGKSGRVANAMRALLRAATDSRRKRVILEIE